MQASDITHFYDKLIGFRTSLVEDGCDWPHQPPEDGMMSKQELQWFLTRPGNAVMVTNGLGQISGFRQTLIKCIWRDGEGL